MPRKMERVILDRGTGRGNNVLALRSRLHRVCCGKLDCGCAGRTKLNLCSSLRIVVARRTRTERGETARHVIRCSMRLVEVRVIVGGVTSRDDSRTGLPDPAAYEDGEGVLLVGAFVAVANIRESTLDVNPSPKLDQERPSRIVVAGGFAASA